MDKDKKLFPQRLWELIHDERYSCCLRWSPDGQRVYLNRNEFESRYLRTPNNKFHTQKAISFVRQMNMYGFRKVDDCYYENDNFKRDRYHLLKNMVRRHSNKGPLNVQSTINSAAGPASIVASSSFLDLQDRALAHNCFHNVDINNCATIPIGDINNSCSSASSDINDSVADRSHPRSAGRAYHFPTPSSIYNQSASVGLVTQPSNSMSSTLGNIGVNNVLAPENQQLDPMKLAQSGFSADGQDSSLGSILLSRQLHQPIFNQHQAILSQLRRQSPDLLMDILANFGSMTNQILLMGQNDHPSAHNVQPSTRNQDEGIEGFNTDQNSMVGDSLLLRQNHSDDLSGNHSSLDLSSREHTNDVTGMDVEDFSTEVEDNLSNSDLRDNLSRDELQSYVNNNGISSEDMNDQPNNLILDLAKPTRSRSSEKNH